MNYERITIEEREEIFRLRYEERLFLREIGQRLHKNKSSADFFLKCEFYGEKLRKESGSLKPCEVDY